MRVQTVLPLRQIGPSPAFFHGGPVTRLEVDPRQRFVLTQGPRSVHVWALSSGEHVCRIPVSETDGVFGWVSGSRIAGWSDGALRLFDPQTGERVRELPQPAEAGPIAAIGGGRFALVNVVGGRPAWWDLLDERPLKRMGGGVTGSSIALAAMSADGQRAWVVRRRDEPPPFALRVWDVDADSERWVEEFEQADDYRAIAAGGGLVALGGRGRAELRHADTFASHRSIEQENDVAALALAPDGGTVLVLPYIPLSGQPAAALYLTADGALLAKHHLSRATAAAFTPDGERYLVADWEGAVHVFDAATGERVAGGEAPSEPTAIGFEPDGRRAGIVHESGEVTVLDESLAPVRTFDRYKNRERAEDGLLVQRAERTLTPDGHRTVRYDPPMPSDDPTIYVWGPGDRYVTYDDERAGPLAVSPDGTQVVSGRTLARLRRWEVEGGRIVSGFRVESATRDTVRAVAWMPDGALVVVAAENALWVLDAVTGASRGTILAPEEIECIAVDPMRPRVAIATYGGDATLTIWDVIRRERIAVLRGHESDVVCAAFHPDGTRLLSAGRDRRVLVWEAPA